MARTIQGYEACRAALASQDFISGPVDQPRAHTNFLQADGQSHTDIRRALLT